MLLRRVKSVLKTRRIAVHRLPQTNPNFAPIAATLYTQIVALFGSSDSVRLAYLGLKSCIAANRRKTYEFRDMLCLHDKQIQYFEATKDNFAMDQVSVFPANEDGDTNVSVSLPVPVSLVLDDVQGIISRAVSVAREAGRDYVTQCHSAAEAVIAVRHDVSFTEALKAVYRVREQDAA